jgi:DNA-binding NarL/FixJ family response regulator
VATLVGESLPMRHLFRLIKRVAETRSTVLIQGETGTGKEADPHPLILDGLQHLFSQESDCQVLACCRTGQEILQAVHQHRPDLVILDPRLADQDSLAVLRQLHQEQPAVQVILLTAALDKDEALAAMRLGVAGMVLKEMPPHPLVQCVRQVAAGDHWLERRCLAQVVQAVLRREAGTRALAHTLSPRELEGVRLIATGLRIQAIADQLAISEGTVKNHLHHIYDKLHVDGRLALLRYAQDHGLL